MKNLLIPCCALLLFWGCASNEHYIEYTVEDASFTFEGPLFSGPNSAQSELAIDLASILDSLQLDASHIHHVALKEAVIEADSLPFSGINSFVLQCTGNESAMVQAAVLNPVTPGMTATLTPAAEADLSAIFKEGTCYALLDADIAEDADTTFTMYGTFKFLIHVK